MAVIPLTDSSFPLRRIRLSDNREEWYDDLFFTNISRKGTDEYLIIDSRSQLIEGARNETTNSTLPSASIGYKNYELTGTLYNETITSGNFFKIPKGVSSDDIYAIRFWDGNNQPIVAQIYYDLLYY